MMTNPIAHDKNFFNKSSKNEGVGVSQDFNHLSNEIISKRRLSSYRESFFTLNASSSKNLD